jgi:hypothetical protein
MNTVTLTIKKCNDCPHWADEDIDEYHGCNYTPSQCLKKKKYFGEEDGNGIPNWCPLLNKRMKP